MVYQFDAEVIKQHIQALSPGARIAFAASCAQRLYPTFREWWNNEGSLAQVENILDLIWSIVDGQNSALNDECSELYMSLLNLIDESLKTDDPMSLYAENALTAIAYVVKSLMSDNADYPMRAAQNVYNAVFRHGKATEKKLPLNGPEMVIQANQTEYVQLELSRQIRDITELQSWSPYKGKSIQDRARIERALPVDVAMPLVTKHSDILRRGKCYMRDYPSK